MVGSKITNYDVTTWLWRHYWDLNFFTDFLADTKEFPSYCNLVWPSSYQGSLTIPRTKCGENVGSSRRRRPVGISLPCNSTFITPWHSPCSCVKEQCAYSDISAVLIYFFMRFFAAFVKMFELTFPRFSGGVGASPRRGGGHPCQGGN